MKTDFYFTLHLTENEHFIVEDLIRKECASRSIEVVYYRKFKTGHIPCYRECKIATSPHIGKEILEKLDIKFENYWADQKTFLTI